MATKQKTDSNVKAVQTSISDCQTKLNQAIRNHEHDKVKDYQIQLEHLETKLQNYLAGAYESLKGKRA